MTFEIEDEHEAVCLIRAAGECTCGVQEEDGRLIDSWLFGFAIFVFWLGAVALYLIYYQ